MELIDRLTVGLRAMQAVVDQVADVGPDQEKLRELLRAAHTLKGASHVVRQPEMARLAHTLEDALGSGTTNPVEMLRTVDAMAAELSRIFAVKPESVTDSTETQARLQVSGDVVADASGAEAAAVGNAAIPASTSTVRVDVQTTTELLEGVVESSVILESLRTDVAAMKQIQHTIEDLRSMVERRSVFRVSLTDGQDVVGSMSSGMERDRRASGEMLDALQSELMRLRRKWTEQTDRLGRELEGLQRSAAEMRLVPASSLLMNAERTVRRTAEELGREIVCVSSGEEERVDLHTLESVNASMLHMVRNAVVHGVEPANQRIAQGKPAAGRIEVAVARIGMEIEFRCTDDGAGVDMERLRAVAVERGWMDAASAKAATEASLLEFVQRPGVSTHGEVDAVAGRGIGMDVVRSTAESLGGYLRLETSAGRGTTVRMRVPMSRFATPALVVESDGHEIGVPLPAIEQTISATLHPIENRNNREFIVVEEERVPLLRLRELTRWGDLHHREERLFDRDRAILVMRYDTERVALMVDAIREQRSLMVQPMPVLARTEEWIGGAYLNGEGVPRMVVDVIGLFHRASRRGNGGDVEVAARPKPLPVLAIDDSLTSRMLEESILRSAGYEVDLAASAEEALEMAEVRSYGLFLVDVEMPGMDGFEFVQRTRRHETMRVVPVVMVTSRNLPGDRERGMNAGASEYVVKSDFQQGRLLRTIARLVRTERRRANEERVG